jgi:hypothetical protein
MLTRILLTRNYYVLNIFEIFLMVLKEKKIHLCYNHVPRVYILFRHLCYMANGVNTTCFFFLREQVTSNKP